MKHNIRNSIEESTCPSSASSNASGDSKTPPQEISSVAGLGSSQVTPDIVNKRMQVKLGRTNTPETLIGTENANQDEEMPSIDTTLLNLDENTVLELARSFENKNEKVESNQNGEIRNEGRRSNDGCLSRYDDMEIYAPYVDMSTHLNPEVALDNIQVNGLKQVTEYGSRSIISLKGQSRECNLHNLSENQYFDTQQTDHEKPRSRNHVNIQLENETLEHAFSEDEEKSISQKSSNSSHHSTVSKRSNERRSLYRVNKELINKQKGLSKAHDMEKHDYEEIESDTLITNDNPVPLPNNNPVSLPTSRQSRPSSCSLPVSCCSSRMSDVEANGKTLTQPLTTDYTTPLQPLQHLNLTHALNKDESVPGNDSSKDLGSYGDILNVLERIEQETSGRGSDATNKNGEENSSSRVSSRRSSSTYLEATPRSDSKTNEGFDISNCGIQSDGTNNDKHIRSSSKMR